MTIEGGSRVLITGGSGFIGTNMVESCLAEGAEVCSIDVTSPRHPDHGSVFQRVDLRNGTGLVRIFREFAPEYLIHLGARTDLNEAATLEDYDANTTGVANLLLAAEACGSLRRAVFASSMLVCAFGYAPKHDFDYQPNTVYGTSKVETERIIRSESRPFSWSLVRPTSIWGPWFGQPYRSFFEYVLSGKFVHPGHRAGTATYGYVGNAVSQIGRILVAPVEDVNERVFYLGDDPPLNLSMWANRIAETAGRRVPRRLPYGPLRSVAFAGDVLDRIGLAFPMTSFRLNNMTTDNIVDLRATMHVAPDSPFSLDSGIQKTLQWLEHQAQ